MGEIRRMEKLSVVHPRLVAFARVVAAESGLTWLVITGARTPKEIAEKWEEGRTRPGPYAGMPGYPALGLTVTNVQSPEKAPHALRHTTEGFYGCALDMQFLRADGTLSDGGNRTERAIYTWYGARAEGLGLVWGGRFPKVDQAHVELREWRDYPCAALLPIS